MNYELTTKLEEAGFPNIKKVSPTLLKLIKACGDDFSCLCREYKSADYKYTASEMKPVDAKDLSKGFTRIVEQGDDPEELVAKVWLKLNNK